MAKTQSVASLALGEQVEDPMRRTLSILKLVLVVLVAACRGDGVPVTIDSPTPPPDPTAFETRLPRAPGPYAPSLLTMSGGGVDGPQDGDLLADVDTCASCHPEVTAQWQSSIHSFASFANPIYRGSLELMRSALGMEASQHCGGCHDMPLEIDGAMTRPVAVDDLRAHTGVSCRVCHGATAPTADGNASFVLNGVPLPTPDVDDPTSVAAHRAAVDVTPLGPDLCVACHRGFISPDLGVPVHLSGIDEPLAWRGSAWNRNGAARIDTVEPQTCITCHMPELPAGPDEYAGADRKVRAHTFAGGHTWMAQMRADAGQLARIKARLTGAATIDVAAAIVPADAPAHGPPIIGGRWHLPADGAPVVAGRPLAVDVVVRNVGAGHRFPGGVTDMQDTWIEVEVADARGRRVAASGVDHARRADDSDAHVLRSYPVDADGEQLRRHELFGFRAVVANHTIAPRDAAVVRYAMEVPTTVALPLRVTARLRHRTRSLENQRATCEAAGVGDGAAFLRQALALRDMVVDPCKPQPITEIASTVVWLGDGAAARQAPSARPAWERSYEHGMALTQVVSERLEEARAVLEHALTQVPAGDAGERPRAMILVQLASVAGKQGRADDALALIAQARPLLPSPGPPALDAYAADALARVWRWKEAEPFARAVTERAPANTAAWVMLARVRGSLGDDRGALAAAVKGLELTPRDSDLLRTQATALAQLVPGSDLAARALAAYDRFRAPDDAAQLRMACAAASKVCARERELVHTHRLTPAR